MKLIRRVTEDSIAGTTTSYVGPFLEESAETYLRELEAHHGGESEFYIEELHRPDMTLLEG